MNKQNRNRLLETENKVMVARWKNEWIKKYKFIVQNSYKENSQ